MYPRTIFSSVNNMVNIFKNMVLLRNFASLICFIRILLP